MGKRRHFHFPSISQLLAAASDSARAWFCSKGIISNRSTLRVKRYGNIASMSKIWNASEYDLSRRRLIPCYDLFYATAADLAAWSIKVPSPAILDLGAGTGLLSEFVIQKVGTASLYLW